MIHGIKLKSHRRDELYKEATMWMELIEVLHKLDLLKGEIYKGGRAPSDKELRIYIYMNKKIECIKRLLSHDRYYEFANWLVGQRLTNKDDMKDLSRDQEKAEFIYTILKTAEKEEKLILLDFEWALLPLETIKITCVTETEKKEFTYGY